MAIIQRGERWQVRIDSKLLPRKHFMTFTNKSEAVKYHEHLLSFLDRGVVPIDLMEAPKRGSGLKLKNLIEMTSSHKVDRSESENPAGLTSSHKVDRSESENPAGLR
jgi:hypothetical protein